MCSGCEIEVFLDRCTHETSILKELLWNECINGGAMVLCGKLALNAGLSLASDSFGSCQKASSQKARTLS